MGNPVNIERETSTHSYNTDPTVIMDIYRKQKVYKEIARHTSVKERKRKVSRLLKTVMERKDEIIDAFDREFKKSATEVDISEIYPFIKECHLILENLDDWQRPLQVGAPITFFGTRSKIVREPKGNTLIISPWNYPFNLTFLPLVSSIASGNTVIIKPSEYTPNVNAVMKSILESVFNEAEAAIIEGDAETAQFLLKQRFDHIHFTGSTRVGQIVMKAAAEYHSSITLELGGKSPAVVDETAKVHIAAKRIVWGKYLNNGQTCIAPDYILAHESIYDSLIDKLKERIHSQYGNSQEEIKASPDLCRIINKGHYERLCSYIDDALAKGAQLEFGNDRDANTLYISPTILSNISHNADLLHEEIFGPILPVIKYSSNKEALAWMKDKDKPLSMYIFSHNKQNIEDFVDETSAGSTCINHCVIQYSHPNLPFGGVNHSGIGKSHGKWAFEEFTYERAMLSQKIRFSASDLLIPPFTSRVKWLVNFMQKWL